MTFVRSVADTEAAVLAAAKDMLRRGLVEGTAGNISARREDGNLVITPSSVDYADMTLDDLVVVDPDGAVLQAADGRSPSTEMKLHLACYQAFDDIGSVIHSHPVWATMFAIAHQPIPACIDEFAIYCGGDIRCSEYAASATPEVGSNAVKALEGRAAALIANHGLVAVGPRPDKVLARHRPGRAHRPNRLGRKGSRRSGPDSRRRQRQLRRRLQLPARQPDVAVPPPFSGSRLTLFSSHDITTRGWAHVTTIRAAGCSTEPCSLQPRRHRRAGCREDRRTGNAGSAIRDIPGDRCSLLSVLFVCASPVPNARRASAAAGAGSQRAIVGHAVDRRRREPRRNGGLHRRERT